MPILDFNEGDRLAAAIVPDGFYKTTILKVDPQPSKSGKSINFWVDFQIQDGKYNGKEKRVCFNSETSSPSVLGDLQFVPHNKFLEVQAAILGCALTEVPLRVNTDELLGKPVDAKWSKGVFNGIVMNTIDSFLPAGKGAVAGATPF